MKLIKEFLTIVKDSGVLPPQIGFGHFFLWEANSRGPVKIKFLNEKY
jgi:hypothetical protein